MPNVSFVRPELRLKMREYTLINDALKGSFHVKAKGELYLPAPEPTNTTEGKARYDTYRQRAVFYNVTKRTLDGLQGQLFARPPLIEVPSYLSTTVANMNGIGVNAMQQCKQTSGEVSAFGRAGLLTDFPTLEDGKEATRADLISGRVASTISFYSADQIINWRYYRDYTTKKLLFVILLEKREIYKPGEFTFTHGKQWRVLRLDESGYYMQELYYDNQSAPVMTARPRDYDGNRLDYIPFEFIGAEDNDPDIDEAPMFSIADLNISHYRNSADFEDSTFFVGQATAVITGLTQAWVNDVMKGEPLRMGSRNAIPLPVGGDIKLVQADPNNLAAIGMEAKEKQMVALGAKLVENKQIARTATEAVQEQTAESSILMTIADNTSVAYAQAFAHAARFVSGDEPQIDFKINTAFEITTLNAAERAEAVKEWQMGALAWPELRQVLRRAGYATLTDDEAKKLIQEEEQQRAAALADTMGAANVQEPGATGATGA